MTPPHIPSWLEDVVAELSARHDAEGVFLVGSRARGDASPASDFDLLVLVDNESVLQRGAPLDSRWEPLAGFAGPVDFLLVSLAELLAGAYAGGPRWRDLVREAYPLHDPLDYASRIERQRGQITGPGFAAALEAARRAVVAADALQEGDPVASRLLASRAAYDLLTAVAHATGNAATVTGISRSLRTLGPGAMRSYTELGLHPPGEGLAQLVKGVEASANLGRFTR